MTLNKWPFPNKIGKAWHLKSCFAMFAVGMWSKFMLKIANKLKIHNEDTLDLYVCGRKEETPLITVSNHSSCLDDPVLWGMLKLKTLRNEKSLRWSLGAQELLYTNAIYSWIFSHGKVIPVVRGDGVYQRGMDFAVGKLNNGDWVHVFPEGQVNMTNSLIRLKWGIGRLIADCKVPPVVLPFWHLGMDDLLPNRRPYIPRICQRITVLVGEPIDYYSVLNECQRFKYSAEKTRKILTDLIQAKFAELKTKAELLHRENAS
ncbi:tafazzin-like [Rhopilema esculentum]|uniref:tafazzin-like n=1 Tax=Rhopilema esculentum TaxID=499914 RepID=UPI0031D6C0F3|eukprot:gene2351-17989_t